MLAYAQCGSHLGLNQSPWRFVNLARLKGPPRWDLLRFDLEQNEVSLDEDHVIPEKVRNQRTYIVGHLLKHTWFPKDKTQKCPTQDIEDYKVLQGRDMLSAQMIILCVRQSLPLGARAQVPLERHFKAMSLLQELESMRHDSFYNQIGLRQAMGQAVDDSNDMQTETRKAQIASELQRIRNVNGTHASEQDVRVHLLEAKEVHSFGHSLSTTCQQTDVPVVGTQKCFTCQRMGHHHKDACFLYSFMGPLAEVHQPVMPWGASKFVQTMQDT